MAMEVENIFQLFYLDGNIGLQWESVMVASFLLVAFICLALTMYLLIRTLGSHLEISDAHKKTVFITGCDSGFGNHLAKTLDRRGVNVVAGCLTDVGAAQLQEVTSSRLTTVKINIADRESVLDALRYVQDKAGEHGLWGLVNNAGVMPTFSPTETTTFEDIQRTISINLIGTMSVTHAFLPLIRRSQGRIVNVCSATSTCAYPGITNYVTSKAGVKMFSSCLRREFFNTGVKVITIEPGGFKTNLTQQAAMETMVRQAHKRASQEQQSFYGGHIAQYVMNGIHMTGKYVKGQPQTVADVMAHALLARCPNNRYLVGADAYLFFRFMSWIPERLGDYVLGWPKPYGKPCPDL